MKTVRPSEYLPNSTIIEILNRHAPISIDVLTHVGRFRALSQSPGGSKSADLFSNRPVYVLASALTHTKADSMLEEFLENWRRGSRGPLPQLTPLQLLNALIMIDREGPVGRRALAHSLQLKDGVVRGLTERLAENKLVSVGDSGVQLSTTGRVSLHKLYRSLLIKSIQRLDDSDLVPNHIAFGIHLSHAYRSSMTGVAQRDAAVKAGALGSIVVAARSGKLAIPPDNKDLAKVAPKENARLRESFKPENLDLVVIGFGQDPGSAMAGALAAVLSLQND